MGKVSQSHCADRRQTGTTGHGAPRPAACGTSGWSPDPVAAVAPARLGRRAATGLTQREKLFRRMAESLPIGLLQVDEDGTLVYSNSRLGAILGIPAGATVGEQLATVVDQDRTALHAAFAEVLRHGADQTLEIDIRVPQTHERRRCSVTLIALTDDEGAPGALACVTDITDSARMREELKIKATFDDLTGCYNRASAMAVLDQALMAGAGKTGVEGSGEALAIAQRVSDALHQQVPLPEGAVGLRASIGVACSEPGVTSDTLIAHADAAMYESKQHRLGRPVLHGASARGEPLDGHERHRPQSGHEA